VLPSCKEHKLHGGIIALGSIEHSIEGPLSALNEFYRVLRDDGRIIITVPYGGALKRTIRLLQKPSLEIKSNKYIRLLFRKSPDERTLSEAKVNTIRTWYPRFLRGKEGCYFFEYEFNKCQMRKFIQEAGFEIINEFVEFGNEGILHNFGKIAGKWNSDRCDVDFTFVGKYLRRILPVSISGVMLCLVIRKL
jgi:SAM-dependent methyltransferase